MSAKSFLTWLLDHSSFVKRDVKYYHSTLLSWKRASHSRRPRKCLPFVVVVETKSTARTVRTFTDSDGKMSSREKSSIFTDKREQFGCDNKKERFLSHNTRRRTRVRKIEGKLSTHTFLFLFTLTLSLTYAFRVQESRVISGASLFTNLWSFYTAYACVCGEIFYISRWEHMLCRNSFCRIVEYILFFPVKPQNTSSLRSRYFVNKWWQQFST